MGCPVTHSGVKPAVGELFAKIPRASSPGAPLRPLGGPPACGGLWRRPLDCLRWAPAQSDGDGPGGTVGRKFCCGLRGLAV